MKNPFQGLKLTPTLPPEPKPATPQPYDCAFPAPDHNRLDEKDDSAISAAPPTNYPVIHQTVQQLP